MKKDHFNLIEDYLDGSMNPEERTEFENLLKSDAELQKLLDERIQLQELYVADHRINELRSKISTSLKNEKQTAGTSIFRNYRMVAAAAVIITLAVFGSVLVFNNRSVDDEEYITVVPLPDSVAGKAATGPGSYANKDAVKGKGTFDDFFPDEFSRLYTSDSICFTWPASMPSRFLMLYDSKGKLVKKIKIKKKASEYWLMPGTLSEGTYYWKFMHDTTLIRISVNNKP